MSLRALKGCARTFRTVVLMTAESPVLTRSFPVGNRTVTLSIPRPEPGRAIYMAATWEPDVPRGLSIAEWAQYRRGRDDVLAELSRELGVDVMVAEV